MTDHLMQRIPLFFLGTACLCSYHWKKLSVAGLLSPWIQFQPVCPHKLHSPLDIFKAFCNLSWEKAGWIGPGISTSGEDELMVWRSSQRGQTDTGLICYQGWSGERSGGRMRAWRKSKGLKVSRYSGLDGGSWLAVTTPTGNGLMEKKKVFQWFSEALLHLSPLSLTHSKFKLVVLTHSLETRNALCVCLCMCVWPSLFLRAHESLCTPLV